ncbi:hypothetical protein CONLIGDRAFT_81180 [Coniochaeta ligniaria NRRL 30616]|uniref:Uncharacterized protein n=1 Tax=Coniochaeta ligniaria NRRL 30616 TaxID=1408157 RepID=A0A1J7IBP0_9PEZI|nr:hypothetical protein CONLIGDRAFT_81180 [Coniochaeta ligniaria NRRL 30616]
MLVPDIIGITTISSSSSSSSSSLTSSPLSSSTSSTSSSVSSYTSSSSSAYGTLTEALESYHSDRYAKQSYLRSFAISVCPFSSRGKVVPAVVPAVVLDCW